MTHPSPNHRDKEVIIYLRGGDRLYFSHIEKVLWQVRHLRTLKDLDAFLRPHLRHACVITWAGGEIGQEHCRRLTRLNPPLTVGVGETKGAVLTR
jgi:hypothetical protein